MSDAITHIIQYLDSNRTNSDLISGGLSFLRASSEFGTGFVYERDPTRVFRLTNFCGKARQDFPSNFSITNLNEQLVDSFIESGYLLLHQDENEEKDPFSKSLLDVFNVTPLLLIPIAGFDNALLGIIGFCHSRGVSGDFRESALSLATAGRVFSQYVSSRIYHGRLDYSRGSLERILDHTGIDIYVNDFVTHEMLYANKSMAAPYGGMDNFTGKKCFEALYDDKTEQCDYCPQKKLIDEEGKPTMVYSWDYQRPFDGSWFRVFSAAFRWVDGRLAHVVSSVDITANKRNEQIISRMANYDSLTDLPNRRKLIADCNDRIDSGAGRWHVLFMDLDGFKKVNDNHGHRAGDELLIQIGRFFLDTEKTRNIYRNGGDEFVVLCDGGSREEVLDVVGVILARFQEPWTLTVGDVWVNTSIGIASCPSDGGNAEDLLQAADNAMYAAKHQGSGNARFFAESGDLKYSAE